MSETDRHGTQPAAEDTGPPVDLRAVRDRAAVVYATAHDFDAPCDACPLCLLAGRDVPALLDTLAAVEAALDEAMPHRSHNRPAAFYVRHLAAVRDAALTADRRLSESRSAGVDDADVDAVIGRLEPDFGLSAAEPQRPDRIPGRDVIAAVLRFDRARRENR